MNAYGIHNKRFKWMFISIQYWNRTTYSIYVLYDLNGIFPTDLDHPFQCLQCLLFWQTQIHCFYNFELNCRLQEKSSCIFVRFNRWFHSLFMKWPTYFWSFRKRMIAYSVFYFFLVFTSFWLEKLDELINSILRKTILTYNLY